MRLTFPPWQAGHVAGRSRGRPITCRNTHLSMRSKHSKIIGTAGTWKTVLSGGQGRSTCIWYDNMLRIICQLIRTAIPGQVSDHLMCTPEQVAGFFRTGQHPPTFHGWNLTTRSNSRPRLGQESWDLIATFHASLWFKVNTIVRGNRIEVILVANP